MHNELLQCILLSQMSFRSRYFVLKGIRLQCYKTDSAGKKGKLLEEYHLRGSVLHICLRLKLLKSLNYQNPETVFALQMCGSRSQA